MSRSVLAALLVGGSGVLAGAAGAGAGQAPAVVVSIKPIHSLVAGVMEGVAVPKLLIEGGGSPHSYALRPSQARALEQAELVFWVGDGLEAFLGKPLGALSNDATVIALGDAEGLRLLATRDGGTREEHEHAHDEHVQEHEHAHEDDHEHGHADQHEEGHDHGAVDMHVWLDPRNAAAMVGTIAAALSAVDPEHAATYEANAAGVRADLARLDAELAATLAPVRDRPFVVFHDAYQYFEERYGLSAVGAITVDPQRAPGAARLQEIRAELEQHDAACVFAEPQFRPALIETVVEGTGAGTGVLDPLGADLAAGPDHYAGLLRALSASLVACLGTPRSG